MNRREFNHHLLSSSIALSALGSSNALAEALTSPDPWIGEFQAALQKKPWLLGYETVSAMSFDSDSPAVDGTIPKSLSGTLYRNGPALHQLGPTRYHHWFDGDGMMHAYRFNNGTITHRGRIVETAKYKKEKEAGRFLYPAFGTGKTGAPTIRGADDVNVANISVLPMGEKLYALWEAGSAYEVDRNSLETIGPRSWSPDTQGLPFSAHPRVDRDGTVWSFGYASSVDKIILWRIDPKGTLVKVNAVDVSPMTLPHDFVVTERYIVILLAPLNYQKDRPAGTSFIEAHKWEPEKPTRILIIDKNTFEITNQLELPAQWVFHFSNAWEDQDGTIRFEGARSPDPMLMLDTFSNIMRGAPPEASYAQPKLTRYRINPAKTAITEEQMLDQNIAAEFPAIDPDEATQNHAFMVLLTMDERNLSVHDGFDTVTRVDSQTGAAQSYRYPEDQLPEEHLFVKDKSGNGWIMGTSLDYGLKKTKLNIFKADALSDGPVAVATLPYFIPLGLHGKYQANG